MGRTDDYRAALRELDDWESYLLEHSGLPGPRANLELVAAVADEAGPRALRRWASLGPDEAPTGGREEFRAVCGVVGLGRLVASGQVDQLAELRRPASDPRWRVREAVAMALQRWGDDDFDGLVAEMRRWSAGGPLERRAAVAALCEPRLLTAPAAAREALMLLDDVTRGLADEADPRAEELRALRKALGYAWSVAIAASPQDGKRRFESLLEIPGPDVRWIVRENLRKKRLERMNRGWTETMRERA